MRSMMASACTAEPRRWVGRSEPRGERVIEAVRAGELPARHERLTAVVVVPFDHALNSGSRDGAMTTFDDIDTANAAASTVGLPAEVTIADSARDTVH